MAGPDVKHRRGGRRPERTGGRDGKPRRDDRRGRDRDEPPPPWRARFDELRAAGIPEHHARQVAQGHAELNDILELLAQREEIDRIMKEHDLSRALATQVVKGHADLDAYLAKRRFEAHRAEHTMHSVLEDAVADGEVRVFGLFGGERVEAKVLSTDVYEVELEIDGEARTVHKLEFKYAYKPADTKGVRKASRRDKALAAEDLRPADAPQDRYTCSDKRMFRYVDEATPLEVTLLGGEILHGTVAWFGRYEFALEVKGGAHVVCFRHALKDLRPA